MMLGHNDVLDEAPGGLPAQPSPHRGCTESLGSSEIHLASAHHLQRHRAGWEGRWQTAEHSAAHGQGNPELHVRPYLMAFSTCHTLLSLILLHHTDVCTSQANKLPRAEHRAHPQALRSALTLTLTLPAILTSHYDEMELRCLRGKS